MRFPFPTHDDTPHANPPPANLPPAHPQLAEGNRLLRALPREEYDRLLPYLEPVELGLNVTLYKRDASVPAVWFIEEGAASWLVDMADGSSVEAGTVGNEGMDGIPIFLGVERSASRSVVQVPGHGKRMGRDVFREALPDCPTLHALLHLYTHALIGMIAQTAACNRLHPLEQRCARWLLMSHDRMRQAPQFYLTQEYLAGMLGVRRAGVSEAASSLQRSGIIRYSRGKVQVLDREGLERAACECYAVVRRQFEQTLG